MKTSLLTNATTGLAGALALAGGSQAYGSIVFAPTPMDVVPTSGTFGPYGFSVDVDNNGTKDYGVFFYQESTTGTWVSGFNGLDGGGGVGVAAPVGYLNSATGISYVSRLGVGYTVNANSAFYQNGTYVNGLASRYNGAFYGQFTTKDGTPLNGWVGFEFTEADGLHFGAVNLTVAPYNSADDPGGIEYTTLEYQSVAGAPLVITDAVPEPGTLAYLAFGAAGAGVALHRRGKKAVQQAA